MQRGFFLVPFILLAAAPAAAQQSGYDGLIPPAAKSQQRPQGGAGYDGLVAWPDQKGQPQQPSDIYSFVDQQGGGGNSWAEKRAAANRAVQAERERARAQGQLQFDAARLKEQEEMKALLEQQKKERDAAMQKLQEMQQNLNGG